MKVDKKNYKKGRCKSCKEIRTLYFGLCQECHKEIIEQAQRKGRENNPFIG